MDSAGTTQRRRRRCGVRDCEIDVSALIEGAEAILHAVALSTWLRTKRDGKEEHRNAAPALRKHYVLNVDRKLLTSVQECANFYGARTYSNHECKIK